MESCFPRSWAAVIHYRWHCNKYWSLLVGEKRLGVGGQYIQAEYLKPDSEEMLANLDGLSMGDTFQIFVGVPACSSGKTYQGVCTCRVIYPWHSHACSGCIFLAFEFGGIWGGEKRGWLRVLHIRVALPPQVWSYTYGKEMCLYPYQQIRISHRFI